MPDNAAIRRIQKLATPTDKPEVTIIFVQTERCVHHPVTVWIKTIAHNRKVKETLSTLQHTRRITNTQRTCSDSTQLQRMQFLALVPPVVLVAICQFNGGSVLVVLAWVRRPCCLVQPLKHIWDADVATRLKHNAADLMDSNTIAR